MIKKRRVRFTPTIPSGVKVMFRIQGRLTDFPQSKPIEKNIQENACFDLILIAEGPSGAKASVAITALHHDYSTFTCNPDGTPSNAPFVKIEATVPNGQLVGLTTSMVAVKKKASSQ